MITRTGAQIIIGLFERMGIRVIAGIPGGANLPLYDALYHSSVIRHILARHEQGAGFIAQGIARTTGRPAVCFATSGPGATNLLTAIADAMLDSVPIICVTGQVPSPYIGTDAFQEVDTYGMSVPITKHNYLVRSAEELLEVIPEAFKIACEGRPGPVLIDVPKDVQMASVSFEDWPADPLAIDIDLPGIDSNAIKNAADLINKAKKPVLYIGGGVIQSEASAEVRQLAEQSNIPVTSTLMGLGALPADHRLSLGMLGMHGAKSTNMILEECDLLIGIGVRFDDRATGKVARFCPNATIIHVDIDESEISKIKEANVGIVGDARTTVQTLLPDVTPKSRHHWQQRVNWLKENNPYQFGDIEDGGSPYGIIIKTAEMMDSDVYVTTDVGQHQMRVAQAYPFNFPRQLLTSGGLGTMGFGIPAALGAALANPGRKVVCFTGDGSLLMNVQELATIVEENADLKIILINNNSLGLVHQQQELFYENRYIASKYKRATDFVRMAESFGMPAYDLGATSNTNEMLEFALGSTGPCLIHAPMLPEDNVYPMVPPGAANIDTLDKTTANS